MSAPFTRRSALRAVFAAGALAIPVAGSARPIDPDSEAFLESGRIWARTYAARVAAGRAMAAANRLRSPVEPPEALYVRPGDFELLFLRSEAHTTDADAKGRAAFTVAGVLELQRHKAEEICWWTPLCRDKPRGQAARARAEEIFAASEQFRLDRVADMAASGLIEAEDRFESACASEWDAEQTPLNRPADSLTAFAVKRTIFERLWRELGEDGDGPLSFTEVLEEGGPAAEFAVSVALDLVALVNRARRDRGLGVGAFRPLAEITARVAREFGLDRSSSRETANV